MKNLIFVALLCLLSSCVYERRPHQDNTASPENNQSGVNQDQDQAQSEPESTGNMELNNIIKLKKLQNNGSVYFFMYIFIEGVTDPIGYYQVNKISSFNSRLTNPQQLVTEWRNSDYGGHFI